MEALVAFSCLLQLLNMFYNLLIFFNRDHMQWSKEEEEAAIRKVEENSAVRVELEEQGSQLHLASGTQLLCLTFWCLSSGGSVHT
jgi:hypothetical protein